MRTLRPTFTSVAGKLTVGYLLIVIFSLVAVLYALFSLHTQAGRSERLIAVDFQALDLVVTLRQNLLAQENLERQFEILRAPALLELLDQRRLEFGDLWGEFAALPLPASPAGSSSVAKDFQDRSALLRHQLGRGKTAPELRAEVASLRQELYRMLEQTAADRKKEMDEALGWFPQESERAFRTTLLLTFLGILLSAPAVITIVLGLHRSMRALTRAAQEIAGGSFDPPLPIADRADEFGLLAREFREMGRKLQELEKQQLDANPLTHLPGNLAIDRELSGRLQTARPFAHLYIDLDNFKAYNDRYGYRAGSEIIARTADLIRQTVARHGAPGDLVGHIGGDDFVILTAAWTEAETLARSLIEGFDRMIPDFYSEEDREAGFFIAKDRFGEKRRFPLLTISIAIVLSSNLETPSPQAVSTECVRMKEHLKTLPGSKYLTDRRKIS